MANDKFFQRKKKNKSLKRKTGHKRTFDRILIVCEGAKTEPNYFTDLIRKFKIKSANVVVDGRSDSAPSSVLKYAKKIQREEEKKGNPFDKIYCVIDKDSHACFKGTVEKIRSSKPNDLYESIISVPCFEVWLLLHYSYSDKPYHKKGKKSLGDCVVDDLKEKYPHYEKGMTSVFEDHFERLENAKINAEKLRENNNKNGTDNPSTNVDILVKKLEEIKSK